MLKSYIHKRYLFSNKLKSSFGINANLYIEENEVFYVLESGQTKDDELFLDLKVLTKHGTIGWILVYQLFLEDV